MSAGHEATDVRDLGDGFYGWACTCQHTEVVDTSLDEARWGAWLHVVLAAVAERAVTS